MIPARKPNVFKRVRRTLFNKKDDRFEDQYTIGELINKGAQGSVYKAYRVGGCTMNDHQPPLAVKIITRKGLSEQDEKQIYREADIMKDLSEESGSCHANKIVGFFVSSKKFHIVQELALGGDVCDWVATNGAYDEDDAREFATILFETIDYYHSRGIVHRDLKAENLLLKDKLNTSIQIADWGHASRLDTELSQKRGTPPYMAPEMVKGDIYDEKVDNWSAGCLLYWILCRRHAFRGEDDKETYAKIQNGEFKFRGSAWRTISDDAKECIVGLLTVGPSKRWTAKQVLECSWIRGSIRSRASSSLVLAAQ